MALVLHAMALQSDFTEIAIERRRREPEQARGELAAAVRPVEDARDVGLLERERRGLEIVFDVRAARRPLPEATP